MNLTPARGKEGSISFLEKFRTCVFPSRNCPVNNNPGGHLVMLSSARHRQWLMYREMFDERAKTLMFTVPSGDERCRHAQQFVSQVRITCLFWALTLLTTWTHKHKTKTNGMKPTNTVTQVVHEHKNGLQWIANEKGHSEEQKATNQLWNCESLFREFACMCIPGWLSLDASVRSDCPHGLSLPGVWEEVFCFFRKSEAPTWSSLKKKSLTMVPALYRTFFLCWWFLCSL